jgi:hypothetical protein
MGVSSVAIGAASSAIESGSGVQQQLAVTALKSAEKSQAAILQLFNPATAVPPPASGRGQNVNISA